MRTTTIRSNLFEPLDLPRLAELLDHALEAFDHGEPDEANACLSDADALGGGFALAWVLAMSAVKEGVVVLEPVAGEETDLEVASGVALASAVLYAASLGKVFTASASWVVCAPPVRRTSLGVLGAAVACLRSGSINGSFGHGV